MTYFQEDISGSNYVYNDTETREFGWRASGQNGGSKVIRMEGIRCVASCEDDIVDVELGDSKLWSDATSWPDGVVPVSGDVMIASGENIIYDLEDSPIFDVVTVNGQLKFLDDADNLPKMNLNAHYIYVRAGNLLIGTEASPFQAEASITLFGAYSDRQIFMSGVVEAGNKILANTGLVEFHGKPRTAMMTRLRSPVFVGYTKTLVEQNLDWVAGDMVYFAPTNHQPYHHEYLEIETYVPNTGLLELTTAFSYYHFGGDSTADQYNGIDVRGEVIMLSRNIKIIGDA